MYRLMTGILIAITIITTFARIAYAQVDTYPVDEQVDCSDFCSSSFGMNFVCAIGYNFSGACVLPDTSNNNKKVSRLLPNSDTSNNNKKVSRPLPNPDTNLCRVVGTCYNKQDDDRNRMACAAHLENALEDCRPREVTNFFCWTDNSDIFGYECLDPYKSNENTVKFQRKMKVVKKPE